MEEKIILRGKLKDCKLVCMLLPFIGVLITLIYDLWMAQYQYQNMSQYHRWSVQEVRRRSLYFAFSLYNGANYGFYPLIVVLAISGYIIYKRWSKVQITITNKRVFGFDAIGKRVDLPLDSITAVGTSRFNGLAVTTASGAIKFTMLKNRDELHEAISKLLVARQEKATTTIKQEIPQSNADELKKYKELLDGGIISQEEFDAKKKQLLGI